LAVAESGRFSFAPPVVSLDGVMRTGVW